MHSRVEEMATKQLQMKVPNPQDVQVIVLEDLNLEGLNLEGVNSDRLSK